jgi:hypothetical protein
VSEQIAAMDEELTRRRKMKNASLSLSKGPVTMNDASLSLSKGRVSNQSR